MTQAIYEPGEKTHKNENFPVASYLIRPKHRPAILAYYRFARAADDVADHPQLTEAEKITRLDQFEATLLGKDNVITEALPLRETIARCGLSPRHALDLLIAFRQDARKHRYTDWGDLIQYCMYSAAPVGRFVLDVHGESPAAWPASDAVCTALQIINHLQDCKADYQRLNRIYIPEDALMRHGIMDTALAEARASSGLQACIAELAEKTLLFLPAAPLSKQIKDGRLALEVLVIEKVAQSLLKILLTRDPLSENVHLTKLQFISIIAKSLIETIP